MYPVARLTGACYEPAALRAGLAALGTALGWARPGAGAFGAVIPAGARVVVKPNWVMHSNKGPWGTECLITHPELVRTVVEALLESPAGAVMVGDAPLQACDFATLVAVGGLDGWAADLASRELRFHGLHDFRRTRSIVAGGVLRQDEDVRPLTDYVLFDLGAASLLEPVATRGNTFRVTQYDPRKMASTHRAGRHQYLIARELMEADVVVNLAKLKTHRKAGMTSALKNLVGINGNKEFLPHHRVGGSATGGDCYPGRSAVKRAYELLLDLQNALRSHGLRRALNLPARALSLASRLLVDRLGVEGAWSGNDTVWRMCLDLNRVLLYGRPDGTMADLAQRRLVSIVDAVVAGQGDGPLAPEPFPLGWLLASEHAAAIDLIGAGLLGYEPARIPMVREAFGGFRWPLASGGAAAVRLVDADCQPVPPAAPSRPTYYPAGWLDAVALEGRVGAPIGRTFKPIAAHTATEAVE
ncbi:MAG: DUF362 domain-containing protein [Gemmatimonadales bacterium]